MTLGVADRQASVGYYDDLARTLVPAYDSISFEQANPGVSAYLPSSPAHVLDIGAGSGRDARALAAKGHHVLAVEPSPAFRSLAGHDGERLSWLDDRLPDLPLVSASGVRFGFILCSAVLMLLPPDDLRRSFGAMGSLLAADGRLAVSLRAPAPGEPSGVFHAHADEEVIAAARAAGLELLHRAAPRDALGRGLVWRSFVFAVRSVGF